MSTSVWEVSHDWWSRVAQKMKRAVVYLDARMAEMLHWSGGMGLLLQAGALDVRDFSSFEVSDRIYPLNSLLYCHGLHKGTVMGNINIEKAMTHITLSEPSGLWSEFGSLSFEI